MDRKLIVLFSTLTVLANAHDPPVGVVEHNNDVETKVDDDGLNETDLQLVFAIFRHGDRTPDQEELDLYPSAEINTQKIFFPYGKKALTNRGKQRGFLVGKYLRQRYDQFISRLYLADEVAVRSTDYSRTKMTALTALAAMYPPPPAQRWNPTLDWQPIPYDYQPYDEDDILYWYNCPRYLALRNKAYELPEVKEQIDSHQELFEYLTKHTGMNITTPEDVFFLDNLFQTLNNVGLQTPQWVQDVLPEIRDVTKLEYSIEFYTDELIRLATGVLMSDIMNATNAFMVGNTDQPKMRLYSAHENNVAALMAAAKVFEPHQPKYGATFSLEFRKHRATGQYGFVAVYAPEIGGPAKILPVKGCGGNAFCDYDTFVSLTQDTVWSHEEFNRQCPKIS